jgi:hypothetical protein
LFRYCEGIVHFDAQISDRAFDFCVSEQKLDGSEIASPPVDQSTSPVISTEAGLPFI